MINDLKTHLATWLMSVFGLRWATGSCRSVATAHAVDLCSNHVSCAYVELWNCAPSPDCGRIYTFVCTRKAYQWKNAMPNGVVLQTGKWHTVVTLQVCVCVCLGGSITGCESEWQIINHSLGFCYRQGLFTQQVTGVQLDYFNLCGVLE